MNDPKESPMQIISLAVSAMLVAAGFAPAGGAAQAGPQAYRASPAATPNSPLPGNWHALAIVGRAPVGNIVAINFRDGRISGNTGCNAFSGAYTLRREILTAGPMITTRRACTVQTNEQEQNLLTMLGERLAVNPRPNGNLVLTARDGRTVLLAPVR